MFFIKNVKDSYLKKHLHRSAVVFLLFNVFLLISVSPALSGEITDSQQFELGKTLFAQGRLDAAYDIFYNLFKNDPGNNDVNFQLGRIAFARGDYESAIMAFERILITEPDSHRIKLEMARCHMNLGANESAKKLFYEVLDTDPPETVKHNILNFLTAIRKSERHHFFNGVVSLGLGWDDNATTAPSNSEHKIPDYPLPITTDPATDDIIYNGMLILNYLYKRPESRFSWQASAMGYNSTYTDNNNLNLNYFSGATGPKFQGQRFGMEIQAIVNHLLLDTEEYLTSLGAQTTFSYIFTRRYLASLGFKYEDRNYVGQIPTAKDAMNYNLNTSHILGFGWCTLYFKLDGEIENAEEDTNTYKRLRPALSVLFSLPKDISLSGGYTYQYTKYDEKTATEDKARKDDQHTYSAGISKVFWRNRTNTKNISAMLNYTFTDANSNDTVYDYRKNTVYFNSALAF